MNGRETLEKLRDLCRDVTRRDHGAALKRALVAVAIPASAGLAVACYGVPLPIDEAEDLGGGGGCADGVDGDDDGLVDCADSDCAGYEVCLDACFNLLDDDSDGYADCEDLSCAELERCAGCGDGLDNDGDGFMDCDDPDCVGDPACP